MLEKIRNKLKRRKKDLAEIKFPGSGFVWHSCQNCEYNFEGNYCPSCGQSVTEVQKPIRHFLHDMFDSLLVFDVRILRSIPVLLLKPGRISSEFVAGRRKKYVPPFRFFLFASIVFFFLIGIQTKKVIDPFLDDSQNELLIDSVLQKMKVNGMLTSSGDTTLKITNKREVAALYEKFKQEMLKNAEDSTLTDKERTKKLSRIRSMENPNYITSQIYKYISWSFFILMPFYALILRVFFRKKRKYYVEHLVFSVNLHTFYFILLIIVVLLNMIFENILKGMAPWIILLAFVYAFVGIRNFYNKRWVSSFFYTLITFFLYIFSSIILLFTTTIVVIAIIGT